MTETVRSRSRYQTGTEVVTFIKHGTLMMLKTNNVSTAMELVKL